VATAVVIECQKLGLAGSAELVERATSANDPKGAVRAKLEEMAWLPGKGALD